MMGRKIALEHVSERLRSYFVCTHLKAKKKSIISTAKTRIVQTSAFWKTFTRQYRNAASQRNHSRKAASMTVPTTET